MAIFNLEIGSNPSPKSSDTRSRRPFGYHDDEDTERIEKEEVDRYWKLYERNPIIRETINSFASRVIKDGYYIEGDDSDMIDEIADWLENSAILGGEFNQNFNKFLKKTIIQREVKGTVLIEKVTDKSGESLQAFKFIPVEGIEIHTKPNTSILVPSEPKENDKEDYEAPKTKDGKLAAYEQVNDMEDFASEVETILFTRDEVIKITRDADIGEVKGTSRIKAVANRAEGLEGKLEDNDEAIASKAYPLWLFKFGSEDNPWDGDDIRDFMKSHEMDNFHPGMKQGVTGDIDVETISGEVAEISEYLQFDIDFIMSAMPMPKYTVGFEQNINQFVSNQQQSNLRRQIREARNDVENDFTPIIREKAEELGYSEDKASSLNLRIGKPDEEDIEEENINVIRYLGVDKDQRDAGEKKDSSSGTSNLPIADSDDSGTNDNESEENSLWSSDVNSFELQSDNQQVLSEALEKALKQSKEDMMNSIRRDVKRRVSYSDTSARVLRNSVNSSSLRSEVNRIVSDTIEETLSEFDTNSVGGLRNRRNYVNNIVNSYEDTVQDMLEETRIQMRRGAERNEDIDTIIARVAKKFNDNKIKQVSNVVSHMEIKNIEETVKLRIFEREPDIIGYRLVNENPETELSKRIDGSEVYFNKDESYSEQIDSQIANKYLRVGFDPIPSVPPLKYGDTTSIVPIYEE